MSWTIFEIQKLPDVLFFFINFISWKIAWVSQIIVLSFQTENLSETQVFSINWVKSNNQSFLLRATKISAMKPELYKINANSKTHLFLWICFPLSCF